MTVDRNLAIQSYLKKDDVGYHTFVWNDEGTDRQRTTSLEVLGVAPEGVRVRGRVAQEGWLMPYSSIRKIDGRVF